MSLVLVSPSTEILLNRAIGGPGEGAVGGPRRDRRRLLVRRRAMVAMFGAIIPEPFALLPSSTRTPLQSKFQSVFL